MISKDWIILKIKELVIAIPELKVRYENHTASNTHFIEVVPSSAFNNNDEFERLEEEITFEFIDKYPNQNICFLSENSIVGIETSDYSEKGNMFDYNQHNSYRIEHKVSVLNNKNQDYIIYQSHPVVIDLPQNGLSALDSQSIKYSNGNLGSIPIFSSIMKESHITAGENTYAMAA